MPRIYADNEAHSINWGGVEFVNGAGAMPSGSNTALFTANSYAVDNSKHALTLFDRMTPAELRTLNAYLGLTIDAGETPDTKQTLVRAIETSLSAKYLAEVAVSSTAGASAGKSDIAITGAGTYKYKTAQTTAPALLYMDVPDSTWTSITSGDDITPTAGHDKITVVKLNAGGYVIGLGSDDIVVA